VHALELDGIRKTFRIRDRSDAIRDALPRLVARLAGRSRAAPERFVALDGVSVRVAPGEALGLVGANGSGKSTVLRIAAGIYPADAGTVRVRGRVSALLELAAGFHPDLSGRENVQLAGALLGLPRREIARVFDRIVAFADIGAFLDAPVRTYSWGMGLRLGFAVAAHVPAEVLLIDEVLAVGDAAFRARCLRRMAERRAEGAAIVFVSHNLAMVERFCDRVVVLERGRVTCDAPPRAALDLYRARALGSAPTAAARSAVPQLRRGNGEARLVRVVAHGQGASEHGGATSGAPLHVELDFEVVAAVERVTVGIAIHALDGGLVAELQHACDVHPLGENPEGCVRASIEMPSLPLLPGTYEMSAWIRDASGLADLDHHQALYPLRVSGERRAGCDGAVDLRARWTVAAGGVTAMTVRPRRLA
jgi:ABC-2 type transport system ATP-binding protein